MCEALECSDEALYRVVLMTVPEFPLSTIDLCLDHVGTARESGEIVIASVSRLDRG